MLISLDAAGHERAEHDLRDHPRRRRDEPDPVGRPHRTRGHCAARGPGRCVRAADPVDGDRLRRRAAAGLVPGTEGTPSPRRGDPAQGRQLDGQQRVRRQQPAADRGRRRRHQAPEAAVGEPGVDRGADDRTDHRRTADARTVHGRLRHRAGDQLPEPGRTAPSRGQPRRQRAVGGVADLRRWHLHRHPQQHRHGRSDVAQLPGGDSGVVGAVPGGDHRGGVDAVHLLHVQRRVLLRRAADPVRGRRQLRHHPGGNGARVSGWPAGASAQPAGTVHLPAGGPGQGRVRRPPEVHPEVGHRHLDAADGRQPAVRPVSARGLTSYQGAFCNDASNRLRHQRHGQCRYCHLPEPGPQRPHRGRRLRAEFAAQGQLAARTARTGFRFHRL
ncbi:hypothetical protein G6F35_010979 [Rhizopus arrhizus]|nr:hypothetical protein G6F35_010979 [Rhizopus arrhizus]